MCPVARKDESVIWALGRMKVSFVARDDLGRMEVSPVARDGAEGRMKVSRVACVGER